jgi:hypothetical protein
MRRILVLLLIAILGSMPLMGMARQASAGSQDTQEVQDLQDLPPCHQSAPKAEPASGNGCDSCKSAGLCCAAFMPPARISSVSVAVSAVRIFSIAGIAAGIVVPPLDPPPLSL